MREAPAVGQGWALWLAGFLALAGGLSLLLNPGADIRLVRRLVGLFLAGWGVFPSGSRPGAPARIQPFCSPLGWEMPPTEPVSR